jgi:uncharacterized membrane protein YhaH (DUF805 family)
MSYGADAAAWYFAENGGQQGPFTREQMAGFARSGRIGGETLIWAQGAPGWTPLKDSPLRHLASGAPPMPPPPFGAQRGAAAPFAAPVGYVPQPSLSFGEAVGTCFRKFAEFKGRARRSEYWFWHLFLVIVGVATAVADLMLFPGLAAGDVSPLNTIASLILLLPSLAVGVRRLHDTDRSGFHVFWWLLPVIGWILLLVFLLQRGTEGPNRFG